VPKSSSRAKNQKKQAYRVFQKVLVTAMLIISLTVVSCASTYKYTYAKTGSTFMDVVDFISRPALGIGTGVVIGGAVLTGFNNENAQTVLIAGGSIFFLGLICFVITAIDQY